MSESEIISILASFLWAGVWIAAPLLGTALIVGAVIGLLQALTSFQEQTLTFVPKLLAVLVAFVLSAGFASRLLRSLFDDQVIRFIAGG